jgi:hypothetical protein
MMVLHVTVTVGLRLGTPSGVPWREVVEKPWHN